MKRHMDLVMNKIPHEKRDQGLDSGERNYLLCHARDNFTQEGKSKEE